MKPFEVDEEGGERLQAFTEALWDALVPGEGACASVQGELVRARGRLQAESLRNGLGNYYYREDADGTLRDNFYGAMLLFLLETLIENRGDALAEADVAYFVEVRREIEGEWIRTLRLWELEGEQEERDLSKEEEEELARLEDEPPRPEWEDLFARSERCIANWCLTNTGLIDREGNPVVERGLRDVMHVFMPAAPPPPCPECGGKGWIPAKTATDFPSMCACRS